MRIKDHICCIYNQELYILLSQWSGKYEIMETYLGNSLNKTLIVFDIFRDDPLFPEINQHIPHDTIRPSQAIYSPQELLTAPWLTVRVKSANLDLAENSDLSYFGGTSFTNSIAQPDVIRITGSKKRSSRQFFFASYEGGATHIFCNDEAQTLLKGITDRVSFIPVHREKSDEIVPGLSYILSQDILPLDAAACFDGTKYQFPQTTLTPIDYDGLYQLYVVRDALNSCKGLCKTQNIFGRKPHLHPMNIVSHEVYVALAEAKMIRNLEFRPVILVDSIHAVKELKIPGRS